MRLQRGWEQAQGEGMHRKKAACKAAPGPQVYLLSLNHLQTPSPLDFSEHMILTQTLWPCISQAAYREPLLTVSQGEPPYIKPGHRLRT